MIENRQVREQKWHDRIARGRDTRGGYFYRWGLSERSKQYAYQQLDDLDCKRVLDMGCGEGETLLRMGRDGAEVVGIDISGEMVRMANKAAQRIGLSNVQALEMPAEQLDFPDASFDVVYGVSIIHHLEIEPAAREIARVLKPGGRAVFIEPLNYNPVINLFRLITPWRRTPDEKPLDVQDLAMLSRPFSEIQRSNFGLTSLLAIFIPIKPVFTSILHILESLDDQLLSRWARLGKYCWITVVTLIK